MLYCIVRNKQYNKSFRFNKTPILIAAKIYLKKNRALHPLNNPP